MYNCRSSNAWPSDTALSVTHYPGKGLSFAILYGNHPETEKSLLGRLRHVREEARHPLLLPGLFAEIELDRHKCLVESSINNVEAKIFELNFDTVNSETYCKEEVEQRSEAKRTAWLDLSYLRNSITTWKTQIHRMVEHVDEVNVALSEKRSCASSTHLLQQCAVIQRTTSGDEERHTDVQDVRKDAQREQDVDRASYMTESTDQSAKDKRYSFTTSLAAGCVVPVMISSEAVGNDLVEETISTRSAQSMQRTGSRLKSRLVAICDEYDEKIRDCTMRVDGMAMATQWVHFACRFRHFQLTMSGAQRDCSRYSIGYKSGLQGHAVYFSSDDGVLARYLLRRKSTTFCKYSPLRIRSTNSNDGRPCSL